MVPEARARTASVLTTRRDQRTVLVAGLGVLRLIEIAMAKRTDQSSRFAMSIVPTSRVVGAMTAGLAVKAPSSVGIERFHARHTAVAD